MSVPPSFIQKLTFSGVAFPIANPAGSDTVTFVRSAPANPSHSAMLTKTVMTPLLFWFSVFGATFTSAGWGLTVTFRVSQATAPVALFATSTVTA